MTRGIDLLNLHLHRRAKQARQDKTGQDNVPMYGVESRSEVRVWCTSYVTGVGLVRCSDLPVLVALPLRISHKAVHQPLPRLQ